MFSTIRFEPAGTVALLTLDRPDKLNAMNAAMAADVWQAMDGLGDARVLIVTGDARAFSAGADLSEGPGAGRPNWNDVVDRLAALPLPTVAAIEGWCLGGGLELAMGCDLRVAAASARLGLPEARRGLYPGGGGTQRLARLVGAGRAKQLMFTCADIDADTALAWGLVNEVAAEGSALEAARALAATITRAAPLSLATIKRVVDEGAGLPLAAGLAVERAAAPAIMASQDLAEGIRAFAERRDPVWQGH